MHRDPRTGESVINTGHTVDDGGRLSSTLRSPRMLSRKTGGMEEVSFNLAQLPSHLKMTAPNYIGLPKGRHPAIPIG